MSDAGHTQGGRLSLTAGLWLVLVCLIWGGNAVSIKYSNQGFPPLMAAAVRSLVAGGLVWLLAAWKGQKILFPHGARRHALVIGFLFGMDFLFLYWGVFFTPASRSTIFLYSHPFWVALGAHFVVSQDRLTSSKIVGLILAFAGLSMVFRVRSPELPELHWIGDMMEVTAAIFWAATTLYIKRTSQRIALTHYQTLFAQLVFAFPILATGSLLFDPTHQIHLHPEVLAALGYQCIVVAFFSYLLWFWMIHNFTVSRLASFTFLAPLFGVILGAAILKEPVSALVWLGLTLVCMGIYMVNR